MIKCGRTGATLLYGTKCVGCDCGIDAPEQSTFIRDALAGIGKPVGPLPVGERIGFDVSSGPEKTASATISRHRVSDRYEYRVEDIEAATHPDLERLIREGEAHMSEMRRRREAAFHRAMWGLGVDAPWGFEAPPRHTNCRSRVDPRNADGTAWTPPAQEIITDPADRRGLDAKPIGGARP